MAKSEVWARRLLKAFAAPLTKGAKKKARKPCSSTCS